MKYFDEKEYSFIGKSNIFRGNEKKERVIVPFIKKIKRNEKRPSKRVNDIA